MGALGSIKKSLNMYNIKAFIKRRIRLILIFIVSYITILILFSYGFLDLRKSSISKLKRYIPLPQKLNVFIQADSEMIADLHLSDELLGHTGEVQGHNHAVQKYNITVAIGLGITGKGIRDANHTLIGKNFQFFHTFIPTFCDTASAGYHYPFYLAYDASDKIFNNESFLKAWDDTFQKIMNEKCPKNLTGSMHFVQCDHAGKPVWAQNDAMLEAYLDNVDYYYRVNDDTKMLAKDWANAFINTLNQYKPSRVGVVGPFHYGGNMGILTYDFVHRTHVDIIGYYYPRTITDWWGDDWMTTIYMPKRMTKLGHITLVHTLGMGQRYGVNWGVGGTWRIQMEKDKKVIER